MDDKELGGLPLWLSGKGYVVSPLIREDLTCLGATKPGCLADNYWVHALEPVHHNEE